MALECAKSGETEVREGWGDCEVTKTEIPEHLNGNGVSLFNVLSLQTKFNAEVPLSRGTKISFGRRNETYREENSHSEQHSFFKPF